MRRLTAFPIVMLLAGHPGIPLACELWCSTPAAATHHAAVGCHGTRDAGVPGEQIIAAVAVCHDAPVIRAFLNETRSPDTRLVAIVSTIGHTAAVLAQSDLRDEGWSVFDGRSSRPPAFRPILRI